MKKFLIAGLTALFVALAFSSCGSEEPTPAPEPQKEVAPLEVMLNGKTVKNGAVEASAPIEASPAGYEFINHVVFKATKSEQLGEYKIRIKKIGGEEVAGNLTLFCLVDAGCYAIKNQEGKKTFSIAKLSENPDFKFNYSLGMKEPEQASESKVSVELLHAGKVIHKFTIKMIYTP